MKKNIKQNNSSYIRDGRAPIPKQESISRVMRANKAKNTRPELLLRKALRDEGIRNYRLHKKNLPGRPDITIPRSRIAIFVNGCFWHRCPHCKHILPKTNRSFWKAKFSDNQKRDKKKIKDLKKLGWKVHTFWECEIREKSNELILNLEIAGKKIS